MFDIRKALHAEVAIPEIRIAFTLAIYHREREREDKAFSVSPTPSSSKNHLCYPMFFTFQFYFSHSNL